MSLVLMTREELDKQALAHYRTPGSKNGQRLYQYEDGSLTPLGRIHYGVGTGRDRSIMKGKTGAVIGKKQVNSDGSLTKHGVKNIEETMRKGSYLNPSAEERKKGLTKERDKVIAEFKKEERDYFSEMQKAYESDPEGTKKKYDSGEYNSADRKRFEDLQDRYAEATLKDLKLPVNERNKGAVKDAFKKYDADYDVDYKLSDKTSEEAKSHKEHVQENREKRFKTSLDEKTDKEIKKDVKEGIEKFNETTKESREERIAKNKERQESLKKELGEIRSLADEELDKRIQRLQKEKQYSELLNERANRERGEFYEKASKLFKRAAENLAQKALNMATDELLKRVSANWNKNKQDNQNQNDGNNQKPKNDQDKNNNGGNSNRFSKAEKSRIRSMAGSGKSVAEIAKSLGVPEEKVKGFMASAGITIS